MPDPTAAIWWLRRAATQVACPSKASAVSQIFVGRSLLRSKNSSVSNSCPAQVQWGCSSSIGSSTRTQIDAKLAGSFGDGESIRIGARSPVVPQSGARPAPHALSVSERPCWFVPVNSAKELRPFSSPAASRRTTSSTRPTWRAPVSCRRRPPKREAIRASSVRASPSREPASY